MEEANDHNCYVHCTCMPSGTQFQLTTGLYSITMSFMHPVRVSNPAFTCSIQFRCFSSLLINFMNYVHPYTVQAHVQHTDPHSYWPGHMLNNTTHNIMHMYSYIHCFGFHESLLGCAHTCRHMHTHSLL